jgi:hypothetical protein
MIQGPAPWQKGKKMIGTAYFERRANLMGAMLRQLDIDLYRSCREALGTTMQNFVRNCSRCRRTEACEKWLAAPDTPEGYRGFCPNADKLDRLPRRTSP